MLIDTDTENTGSGDYFGYLESIQTFFGGNYQSRREDRIDIPKTTTKQKRGQLVCSHTNKNFRPEGVTWDRL